MKMILIIDDEENICTLLGKMFKREGFDVLTAGDGKKGIMLFKENRVDLVITDIIMPEKEGLETILELKKLSPETPIIAMSGGGRLDSVDYLKIAKQMGAKYTFNKPFEKDNLLLAVHEALKDVET